ncbi:MAG: tetratricopeptide repeat protein [Ignavibacteria bacterium]|nr:tetratricopeptide repeat protein [Ignavibacteria bacterium]
MHYFIQKTENYEKSESLYLEALRIDKTTLGENHPDYATGLNNIALLYEKTGNYEKLNRCISKH